MKEVYAGLGYILIYGDNYVLHFNLSFTIL